MADLPPIVDNRQSPTALRVQRGVMRLLRAQHDYACLPEVPLANGRRADLVGIGPQGEVWIVEIKSSLADYQLDTKWPQYKDFCDRFFFAKPPELDPDIFPPAEGLIVADGHDAALLRMAPHQPLQPARRKALFAHARNRIVQSGPHALVLEGVASPVSGLQATQSFRLSGDTPGTLELGAEAVNRRDRDVRRNLWFNTRLPAGSRGACGKPPRING